uniref:Moesin/ezrin/radixin homolog 1 n=1 Tax=Panagrellus redivivus TaxID=6233 RepID=A0A7E5A1B0_PANRE
MDADLEAVPIEADCYGRDLFDVVCRIIGMREVWYFGLQHVNKKGFPCWLQMDKKILNQDVVRQSDGSYFFLYLVKYYPEVIEDELVQDITRHLFFLQIKQSILSEELYCQPEAAVLLASYAVQAMHGDHAPDIELELDKLLPKTVIHQYDMTADMWKERIRSWWANNSGLSVEEAEMEYLRVAQDLSVYGYHYYPIFNQKDTDLLLGISAQGVGIYELMNRVSPRAFFPWSDIRNIQFNNKLFTIKVTDKSKIKFRSQEASVNHSILDLCIGTHNLYLRRRQTDSLEIQQMKIQAQEQREKRAREVAKHQKEREQRIRLEHERDRLKSDNEIINGKLSDLENAMRSTKEANRFYAEKARISETEALELSKRANQAEAEAQRSKMSQIEAEEMKITLERKLRDAHRIIQETGQSTPNLARSHHDLFAAPLWNYTSQSLHQQLMLNRRSDLNGGSPDAVLPLGEDAAEGEAPPVIPGNQLGSMFELYSDRLNPGMYSSQFFNVELNGLRDQMQKSSDEYRQRNLDFRTRLADFRREIEALKIEDRQTENDKAHESNLQNGLDRYASQRKSELDLPSFF